MDRPGGLSHFRMLNIFGKVVRPEAERALLAQQFGALPQFRMRRGRPSIHDQRPGPGEAHRVVLLGIPVVYQSHLIEGIGRAFHHRIQSQIGVGDVDRQDAGRFQVLKIDSEGFFSRTRRASPKPTSILQLEQQESRQRNRQRVKEHVPPVQANRFAVCGT